MTVIEQEETEETKESGETITLCCLCSLLFSLAAPNCSAATWAADRTVFEDVSSILKTNGITRDSDWRVMLKHNLHEFVNGLLAPSG